MSRNQSPDKKDQILAAATRCFAQKGYHRTRISDIAREAGIADGTIYLYFPSKDSILAVLFDETMDRFIVEGLKELAPLSDPREKLMRIIDLHLERLGEDRHLAIVFQVELRHNIRFLSKISHDKLQDYLRIIGACVAEGQSSGAFRTDVSPQEVALVLFGALDQLATSWVLSDRNYQLRKRADLVQRLIFDGIRPPDAEGVD